MYVPGTQSLDEWTAHSQLKDWIKKQVALCKPDRVHLVTGSAAENADLIADLVHAGVLVKCNEEKWPGCYLARSTTSDVARVESRTIICSEKEVDAGPTNIWKAPAEMMTKLTGLFDGSHKGRTMYAIPFSMGPLGSPLSSIGIQLTDSAYGACCVYAVFRSDGTVLATKEFLPYRLVPLCVCACALSRLMRTRSIHVITPAHVAVCNQYT